MPDVRSISRRVSPLRAPLLALTLLAVLTRRGVAQDRFEIEVYPYETAARGEWELDTHLNYTRLGVTTLDRKSTRLNSSHSQISYAVFCLKKKKNIKNKHIKNI